MRAGRTRVLAIAPFTTRGLTKMHGTLVPTAPGAEPAALDALVGHADYGVDKTAVILLGERLATVPGALSAASSLAQKTGARLAWVPRRAGDRGALETGCLPTLLPGGRPVADASARVDAATTWGVDHLPETPGRDGDAIVAALAAGELSGLVVGGIDPDDTADPAATRAAIEAASFVVALEIRETELTRQADVVFPVAPVTDKAGMFVTWEGRPRPFDQVLSNPASLPDLRILSGIAEELGSPLGFRTVAEARAQMEEMGPWDGPRATMTPVSPSATTGSATGRAWRWPPGSRCSTTARCRTATSTSPQPPGSRWPGSPRRSSTPSAPPSRSPVTAAR